MRVRAGLMAAAALFALTACGDSGAEGSSGGQQAAGDKPTNAAAAANRSIKFVDSAAGRILVDQQGRTLYAFTKDKDNNSNCDADCIAVWPAFTAAGGVELGDGVRDELVGSAKQGGANQVTYGDWPLYYYVGDAVPGDVNGQGIDDEWFLVAPDGKLIKENV